MSGAIVQAPNTELIVAVSFEAAHENAQNITDNFVTVGEEPIAKHPI
jgi:hypothetical protein